MKTALGMALAGLAVMATAATAGQVEYGSGVFSPEHGVICDREGNWCADGTGISATWTEQYMGAEAAGKLVGAYTAEFAYANHVVCTVATQSCTGEGKLGKKMTKRLFK